MKSITMITVMPRAAAGPDPGDLADIPVHQRDPGPGTTGVAAAASAKTLPW